MSSNFLRLIQSAEESKCAFDSSMNSLKDFIKESVKDASSKNNETHFIQKNLNKIQSTGWLKGSLSYPWVVVCIIVPAVLETTI